MPQEVLEVTKKFMRDPVRILVKKEELTLEGIKQFYVNVGREVNIFNNYIYLIYIFPSISTNRHTHYTTTWYGMYVYMYMCCGVLPNGIYYIYIIYI